MSKSFLRGLVFFWQGFACFFIWSFLLCKRLFVALVILKSVVVCVGFVRSGENKKETDQGCLIPNLHTVGGWIVFIEVWLVVPGFDASPLCSNLQFVHNGVATGVVTMISFGHVILLGHDFDLVVHRVLLVYRVILVHKCYP